MQLTRHLDANARLVSLIEPLALRDGYSQTGLPGVQILRASCDVARGPHIYEPSLMIIAQGSKLAFLGPRTMEYGAGHYLIQALPVPFECETFALPNAPLLGVSVAIDRVLLGELVLAMGLAPGRHIPAQTPESMTSVVLDDGMRGCVERLLSCLHDPLECQILLVAEGLGVAQVAHRVGYQSTSQFSREYKRYFERSPGDERAA